MFGAYRSGPENGSPHRHIQAREKSGSFGSRVPNSPVESFGGTRRVKRKPIRPRHSRFRHRGSALNSPPLLDTHIWIWWILEDPRLPKPRRVALDSYPPNERPFLADISLWEASLLISKGRLVIDQDAESWLALAASPAVVQLCPISPSVAAEVGRLPAAFHQDPADRLIVATARNKHLPLATMDQKIIEAKLTKIW